MSSEWTQQAQTLRIEPKTPKLSPIRQKAHAWPVQAQSVEPRGEGACAPSWRLIEEAHASSPLAHKLHLVQSVLAEKFGPPLLYLEFCTF